MEDFIAKKLAEVEAFCIVSGQILERAGGGFDPKYGDVAAILEELSAQSVESAITATRRQPFDEKVEATITKLTDMMERYIGDDWDNPEEVLEWCSFFAGAGAAHCALAAALEEDLENQLTGMSQRFEDCLHQVMNDLRLFAADKRHS